MLEVGHHVKRLFGDKGSVSFQPLFPNNPVKRDADHQLFGKINASPSDKYEWFLAPKVQNKSSLRTKLRPLVSSVQFGRFYLIIEGLSLL